jgi:hypothetical protein
MRSAPKKRRESGALKEVWQAFNELVDFTRETAPMPSIGSGVTVTRTSNGTLYKVSPCDTVAASPVNRYLVTSVANDHLVCRLMSGSSTTGEDVLIAKPNDLRRTGWHGQIVQYTIETTGLTRNVSYSFVSAVYRTATSGTTVENQVIRPPYVANRSVIFAVESDNGTGVDLAPDLIDLNTDGRAFAKI